MKSHHLGLGSRPTLWLGKGELRTNDPAEKASPGGVEKGLFIKGKSGNRAEAPVKVTDTLLLGTRASSKFSK